MAPCIQSSEELEALFVCLVAHPLAARLNGSRTEDNLGSVRNPLIELKQRGGMPQRRGGGAILAGVLGIDVKGAPARFVISPNRLRMEPT